MRVSKQELIDAEQRIRTFIKGNQREPNTVALRDMDTGKEVTVPIRQVNGLYFNTYIFWLKNGRYPNFATLNTTKSEPTIQNFQDTSYSCCPASLSMISTKLFRPKTEAECATALGTTKNGTNPTNLINNAPKLGFTAEAMTRTPKNVSEALGEYKGVMVHYMTKNASCSGFINQYGHYAVIKSVGDGRYTVMDPTKGLFTCPTSVLDGATAGRQIWYYKIGLK